VRRDGRSGSPPECQYNGREVLGISRGADPADPRVAPEPDPLAAGELAGAADGEVEGLVDAGQVGLRVMALDRGQQVGPELLDRIDGRRAANLARPDRQLGRS